MAGASDCAAAQASFDNALELNRAMICTMLLKGSISRCLTDAPELFQTDSCQNCYHLLRCISEQDLFVWGEEIFDAGPRVREDSGTAG
jgi:hypothetical protein